jgi:glutaredoxin
MYLMKRFVWVLSVLVLVWLLAGCGKSWSATSSSPAVAELVSCLTKNGATFYGTEWCPHCKEQKKIFGEAFVQVNYIDCDKNKVACDSAKVKWYPTWVFADGSTLVGTQTLEALAAKSGCSFAPEALIPEAQKAQAEQAKQASGV